MEIWVSLLAFLRFGVLVFPSVARMRIDGWEFVVVAPGTSMRGF